MLRPAKVSATCRFSIAVKSSFKPPAWPMYKSERAYCSRTLLIFSCCQRTSPADGSSKPHSIRSKLVLPAPFEPVTRNSSPAWTWELIWRNSKRDPRTQANLSISSMISSRGEIARLAMKVSILLVYCLAGIIAIRNHRFLFILQAKN